MDCPTTAACDSSEQPEARLPQVDVYGAVHKGIRYALLDLLRRMGTVAPNDGSGVEMVLDDLDGAFYLCAAHSAQEERYVHAVIEAESPGALSGFDAAHAALGEVLESLREATGAVLCAKPAARPGLFRLLYLRYSSFVARALEHMSDEELVVQALLERLFPPERIRDIQINMLGSIGPEELLVFLRVMVPAATPNERAALLASPKASLSRDAFEAIMRTVRRCLTASEVRDLERRLEQLA
jgi:hypothetical protein